MKIARAAALTAAILSFIAAGFLWAADDADAPLIQSGLITMNFQNVDIPVLAKFISQITGKNFIIDENVRGKVSIVSPTKVTPAQAYQIFQSVLQLKGFTTVRAGSIIKIVPARDVRQSAQLTTAQQPALTEGDQYVTRMVKLRNVDVDSLVSVIQPMVSHDGLVAAFPQDNTLIITDDAYNVGRLLKIIGSLDVQGTRQRVKVIPLKYGFADDMAPEIEKIMGSNNPTSAPNRFMPRPGMGVVAPAAQGPAGGFKVIPDERTNSLIALAGPIQMREIEDLVTRLDIVPLNATSRIHVYHLKNARALDVVGVLSGLLGGGGGPTQPSATSSLGLGSVGMLTQGGGFGGGFGAMGGMMGGGYGGSMGGYGGGMGGYGGSMGGYGGGMGMGMGGMGMGMGGMGMGMGGAASTGPVTASGGGATSGPGGSKGNSIFANPVSVTADPSTNSLVISAAPQDYQTLKKVITDLDIPRLQVFVQAIIVEVSAERSRDIGVNFQSGTGISNSVLGSASFNTGQLQNALGNPLGLTGLGLGLASGSVCSIPTALASAAASGVTGATASGASTMSVPCDIALMIALEQDTHADVLSAPTLLTADNSEAMIVVGQNIPLLASSSANAAIGGAIFNSIDRQNVGIMLDIMPQVSQGEYVKLDVYEQVSNVVASTANNPNGPTTTIRSAATTVMVQDHRTAVIGGLMSSQVSQSRTGVPYISDIPVLGNLFGERTSDHQKDNLLVFLTPHIVRTREDLRSLALDERQKFINSLGQREMHGLPMSQARELYKPNFSVSVTPAEDLKYFQNSPPPASFHSSSTYSWPASASGPLNTKVITPNPMLRGSYGGAATGAPGAPATGAPSGTAGSTLDSGAGPVSGPR